VCERLPRGGERDFFAIDADLAIVGSDCAGKNLSQGRLPGPVFADEGSCLAGLEREAHALEHAVVTVLLCQAVDGQEWFYHFCSIRRDQCR
jgi:hypothetical protein